jgi:hypothetical protein
MESRGIEVGGGFGVEGVDVNCAPVVVQGCVGLLLYDVHFGGLERALMDVVWVVGRGRGCLDGGVVLTGGDEALSRFEAMCGVYWEQYVLVPSDSVSLLGSVLEVGSWSKLILCGC